MELKTIKRGIVAALVALAAMMPACMAAYSFVEGGIYYDVVGSQATVTYNSSNGNSYSGSVVIPETVTHNGVKYSVTAIGNSAFSRSSGLTDVTIPNSIVSIGNHAFTYCTNLKEIVIPNSVQTMGRCAFHTCSALQTAVIGNSVKLIDEYAFQYCSNLSKLVIGSSVDSLAIKAFFDCPKLADVTCLATTPPKMYAYYSFDNYNYATLHVYQASIAAYRADINWKRYHYIEGISSLAEQLTLDQSMITLHGGECQQLTASVLPEDAFTTIMWSSSDSEVATVDANGMVSALSAGLATITATTTDGSNLSASCLVRVLSNGVQDNNVLTLPTTLTVEKSKGCMLPVGMTNKNAITAVQYDINLPEGFDLATDDNGYLIDLLDSRAGASHGLYAHLVAPQVVRVVISSPQSEVFTGNDGDLMLLHLDVSGELEDGDYDVSLTNVILADASGVTYFAPDVATIVTVKSYATGDANGDGTVNVGDYVSVANYILEMNPDPFVFSAADVDENGIIDVGDLVGVANIVLGDFVMPANAPRYKPGDMALTGESTSNGEYGYKADGTADKVGQATADHLFVRGDYDNSTIDNTVTFDQGDTKLVWLWLDDDAIYNNATVQALTPVPYNAAGDLYNEITYNSFQCDIYLPDNVSIISVEDEESGDEVTYAFGDRMPRSALISYKHNGTKTIDGKKYNTYTLLCANSNNYGCHFSAKNAARYQADGALKKDDAPLIGLYLHCEGASSYIGEMPNMIIANLEFGFREAFTATPKWEPNEYRFFYGSGGNNNSQRFQYYQRVRMFGNGTYEITETPTITHTVNSTSVVVTATGQGDVVLMIDGERVNNPCTIERGEQSKTILATATAQEEGKAVSDLASQSILVPAKPGSTSDNVLKVESPILAVTGNDFDLPVALENGVPISALQCDVYLPDGITLTEEGVSLVEGRMSATHSISIRTLGDGAVRVLIASPEAEVFSGNAGDLFVLHLNAAPEMADGAYNVMLGNIVLADASATTYYAPDVDATVIVKSYAKGDANGDGLVNVGDYVTTANFIMALNPDPFIFTAADVDENETIDVGDLVGIVNIVLGDFTMPENAPRYNDSDVTLTGESMNVGDSRVVVTLNLDNKVDLTALQMDLALPEGMTLSEASLSSRASHHSLAVNELADGNIRLLCSSSLNDVVTNHEGALLTLVLEGHAGYDASLTVSDVVLAETDMTTHAVNPFSVNVGNSAVKEFKDGLRIYAQGENIVVETPVDTSVEIITTNGMSRTVTARAGVNTYPVERGIIIVRAAGQVAKLKI